MYRSSLSLFIHSFFHPQRPCKEPTNTELKNTFLAENLGSREKSRSTKYRGKRLQSHLYKDYHCISKAAIITGGSRVQDRMTSTKNKLEKHKQGRLEKRWDSSGKKQ